MYQMLPVNLTLMFSIQMTSFLMIMSIFTFLMMKEKKKEKSEKLNNFNKKILSLFSSFEPVSSEPFFKETNWAISIMLTMFMILNFSMKSNRVNLMILSFLNFSNKQFMMTMKKKNDGGKKMFTSLLVFILMSNLMGMIPMSFTSSSHLTWNMFISIPWWTSFIIFGWMNFWKKMMSHLVPSSTPTILISFMVMIEMISTLIRPFTLSIRLMANMISGHLLLTLLGNSMNMCSFYILILPIMIQTMLMILELSVCLIQAYVFCILLALYSEESDLFLYKLKKLLNF